MGQQTDRSRVMSRVQNSPARRRDAGRRNHRRHARRRLGVARRRRRPVHGRVHGAEPVERRLHHVGDRHQQRRREVVVGRAVVVRGQPAGDPGLERAHQPERRGRHRPERDLQRHAGRPAARSASASTPRTAAPTRCRRRSRSTA